MKNTISNILFNISMFIACKEEKVSYHKTINNRMYRRKDRCVRICGIPFKKTFTTEWVA